MKFELQKSPTLEYLIAFPDEYKQHIEYPIIFCLHGFGADKEDLSGIVSSISSTGYIYILPDAPQMAFDGADFSARAWYERGGNESKESVATAIEALDGLVKEVFRCFPRKNRRSLLLGFSQGGAMTLRYGISRPELFSGLAVLSGSLKKIEELANELPEQRNQPIFVAHGKMDQMVPISWSERLVEFLNKHRYKPTYQSYRIGHYITPELMDDLRNWITKVIPPVNSK